MLVAAGQAFQQLFTPPFRVVLLKSIGFTLAVLVALIVAAEWVFTHFVHLPGWIEHIVQLLGGLALVAGSVFLIPAVSALIAGLYLDDIADEVERVYYPGEPQGHALPVAQSTLLAVKFFFIVIAMSLLQLVFLLFIPGLNLLVWYAVNGYLLGREYFELAAMRHLPIEEAKRLCAANMGTIFIGGVIVAALSSVPILNLITPLFATALMVHVYKNVTRRNGARAMRPRAA